MTVDIKCYALAKRWLEASGHTYSLDVDRLATRIQEACEDFDADLANAMEAEHDRSRQGS